MADEALVSRLVAAYCEDFKAKTGQNLFKVMYKRQEPITYDLTHIYRAVMRHNTTPYKLSARCRKTELGLLKKIFSVIAYHNGHGTKEIAKRLMYQNHTSIVHNVKQFRKWYSTDPELRELYDKIERELTKISDESRHLNAVQTGTDPGQLLLPSVQEEQCRA